MFWSFELKRKKTKENTEQKNFKVCKMVQAIEKQYKWSFGRYFRQTLRRNNLAQPIKKKQ